MRIVIMKMMIAMYNDNDDDNDDDNNDDDREVTKGKGLCM